MNGRTTRRMAADRGTTTPAAKRSGRVGARVLAAAAALTIGASATALANGGGVSSGGGGGGSAAASSRFAKVWDGFNAQDHRWAHRTSYCESGENPRAIGGGGRYRGAFQFTRDAWKTSPRSPGGDPIRYAWKTQAVVAVLLKHRDGTRPWPVCG